MSEAFGLRDVSFDELETAWWKWVDTNCPSKSPRARGRWMYNNAFSYDGTTWRRNSCGYKSNSGMSIVAREVAYISADGRAVHKGIDRRINRRNDPERNWGLGRD
jgi:hypothetical protein